MDRQPFLEWERVIGGAWVEVRSWRWGDWDERRRIPGRLLEIRLMGVRGGRVRFSAGGCGSGFAFAAVLVIKLVDFFWAHGAEPPSGDEGEVV